MCIRYGKLSCQVSLDRPVFGFIANLTLTFYKGMSIFFNHRLSINKPTKSGEEKSPSDGDGQCEKEMDHRLVACQ
jgi:hypothetical protein